MWVATGRAADKVPPKLSVMPLKKIVELMLSGKPDGLNWRSALFVGCPKNGKVANACAEASVRSCVLALVNCAHVYIMSVRDCE